MRPTILVQTLAALGTKAVAAWELVAMKGRRALKNTYFDRGILRRPKQRQDSTKQAFVSTAVDEK